MKVSNRKKRGTAVDLTPMIDVVFQLILFFLVSTTFAILPAINVNLPESSTAQGADIAGITITMQSNGKMWFNDEQVSFSTLGKKLATFDTEGKKKEEYPVTLNQMIQVGAAVFGRFPIRKHDEVRRIPRGFAQDEPAGRQIEPAAERFPGGIHSAAEKFRRFLTYQHFPHKGC